MIPRSPSPPRPRAVLFDWDNTLVDSWLVIHDALNTTFAAMDHPPWTFDQTRDRVRRSLRETFPEMFGDKWQEARDIFYGRFRAIHLDKLIEMPGATELVEAVSGQGFYLGVVSNKSGDHLRREAAHLGWDVMFGGLVGATDATRDKPALEPVLLALGDSGIAPGRDVWFVGDTLIDMECAHNAGCIPVLISEDTPGPEEFDAFPPEFHFRDCGKLARVVINL